MNWIKRWFDYQKEALVIRIAYAVRREIIWTMLSDIGLADLEKIVQHGKENQENQGITNYNHLVEIYMQIMKDRRKK